MDIQEKIDYWLDLVEYDIEVSQSLFNSKKYLYVGFFCHLIIEKTLKAYFWYNKHSEPPFSHNLILLADKSGLLEKLSKENIKFLNLLMPLNIEGRYPKDKQMLSKELPEIKIEQIINTTLELYKWIRTLIKY